MVSLTKFIWGFGRARETGLEPLPGAGSGQNRRLSGQANSLSGSLPQRIPLPRLGYKTCNFKWEHGSLHCDSELSTLQMEPQLRVLPEQTFSLSSNFAFPTGHHLEFSELLLEERGLSPIKSKSVPFARWGGKTHASCYHQQAGHFTGWLFVICARDGEADIPTSSSLPGGQAPSCCSLNFNCWRCDSNLSIYYKHSGKHTVLESLMRIHLLMIHTPGWQFQFC